MCDMAPICLRGVHACARTQQQQSVDEKARVSLADGVSVSLANRKLHSLSHSRSCSFSFALSLVLIRALSLSHSRSECEFERRGDFLGEKGFFDG